MNAFVPSIGSIIHLFLFLVFFSLNSSPIIPSFEKNFEIFFLITFSKPLSKFVTGFKMFFL